MALRILDNMFGTSVNSYSGALDRTSRRQAMLMGNLANVNVPGYKRKDIDFHVMFQDALGRPSVRQNQIDRENQQKSDQTSIRYDGNNVDLEREVASIAETEQHYEALTQLTAGYFAGLKNVIKEGK